MRIVILGGGYAGATAVRGLAGIEAEVLLINRHLRHHLTTMLHQPVVGRRSFREVSIELKEIARPPARVQRGFVRRLDLVRREVHIVTREGASSVGYDQLVIALGWEPLFYDIEGLREHGHTLESISSSRLAQDKIEHSLLQLDEHPDESWRRHIVIGGGGLAGVELAGELAEVRPQLAHAFDLHPQDICITVVEMADALLPGIDEGWMASAAADHLRHQGVEIVVGARITSVARDHVILDGSRKLPAGVLLWTGGVRANRLIADSGFETAQGEAAIVDDFLRPPGHDNVFIIGDCALTRDEAGDPLPPTAQFAVQHGRHTAMNLKRLLAGQPLLPFKPKKKGIILSIGSHAAIGDVNGRRVRGLPAILLKDAIALAHVFRVGGPWLGLKKLCQWLPSLTHLRRPEI